MTFKHLWDDSSGGLKNEHLFNTEALGISGKHLKKALKPFSTFSYYFAKIVALFENLFFILLHNNITKKRTSLFMRDLLLYHPKEGHV